MEPLPSFGLNQGGWEAGNKLMSSTKGHLNQPTQCNDTVHTKYSTKYIYLQWNKYILTPFHFNVKKIAHTGDKESHNQYG